MSRSLGLMTYRRAPERPYPLPPQGQRNTPHSLLRVGFLSSANYFDRYAWSGILYHMFRSLSERPLHVIPLGNPRAVNPLIRKISRRLPQPASLHSEQEGSPQELQERFVRHLRNQEKFVRRVRHQLKHNPCDVIFAPAAASEIFSLRDAIDIPITYLSDTTFKLLSGSYPQRYPEAAAAWLERAETVALTKAKRVIFPSAWAAQSAITDYHTTADKIATIPFGANVDAPADPRDCLQKCNTMDPCRLLLVGRWWHRKGGDIAAETLKELRNRGLKATLTIVGCTPPEGYPNIEGLEIIPYLDKNKPKHRLRFAQLLSESHLFLLPTRADCSPIAICEANAYGLPAITTDVGGLPEMVANGKNGYALPQTATAAEFASKVEAIVKAPETYRQLVWSSRCEFDRRFGWSAWGQQVQAMLEQVGRSGAMQEELTTVPMEFFADWIETVPA